MKKYDHVRGAIVVSLLFFALSVITGPKIFSSADVENPSSVAAVSQAVTPSKNTQNTYAQFLVTQIHSNNSSIQEFNKIYQKSTSATDRAQLSKVLTQKAQERKESMKKLMKEDPRLFQTLAITSKEKALLSKDVQSQIEQFTTITGKVSVVHIDDFKDRTKSRFEYKIKSAGKTYSYHPTTEVPLLSGTTIRASGYVIDDQFSSNVTAKSFAKLDEGPKLDSVGNQRTLVILVKSFAGDPEPFTTIQAKDLVFKGQFQNFMKEQSYNNVSFDGDVIGWVPLGRAIDTSCLFLNEQQLSEAVTASGINLANYDRIAYLLTNVGGGCSYVGKGDVTINSGTYRISMASIGLSGYNQPSWWGAQPFTWTNLDYVMSHEIGHSLGVMHANGWDCGNQSLNTDCTHVEYGNAFDTMGTGTFGLHFNAFYKDLLGWLPNRILSIQNSGIYTINPLEAGTGFAGAKIQAFGSTKTPYYVEYRKAMGFDSIISGRSGGNIDLSKNNNGIFINSIVTGYGFPHTRLIDTHPTSLWFSDDIAEKATLNFSTTNTEYFTDVARGVRIGPVTNITATSTSFKVTLTQPECQRISPKLSLDQWNLKSVPGGDLYVQLTITNQDYYGCGTSIFKIKLVSSQAWEHTVYPEENQELLGGDSTWGGVNLLVPEGTSFGQDTLRFELTNINSGLTGYLDVPFEIIAPFKITGVTPSSGVIGTDIAITGNNFDPDRNYLSFYGKNGGEFIPLISSMYRDGAYHYTVPSELSGCDESGCRKLPTADGNYELRIHTTSSSDAVDFYVGIPPIKPTATIIDNPTIAMEYDSLNQESLLRARYKIQITAGNTDVRLHRDIAFRLYFSSPEVPHSPTPTTTYSAQGGDWVGDFYVIPAGASANLGIESTVNPRIMYAGRYHASLYSVTIGDFLELQSIEFYPPATTGDIVVIGEQMPTITSITPNPAPQDSLVTLGGMRFSTTDQNIISITSIPKTENEVKITTMQYERSYDGTSIRFRPNVSKIGDYIISVSHPLYGSSNMLGLSISSSTETLISFDFGGMYGYYTDGSGATKTYVNPATNKASCPYTYKSFKISGTQYVDHEIYACYRPHIAGENSYYDFGGMYGQYLDVTSREIKPYVNPITQSNSCSSGYLSSQISGTNGFDHVTNFCYRPGTRNPQFEFGGAYGYSGVTAYVNPTTKYSSCRPDFYSFQVKGSIGSDYPVVYCINVAGYKSSKTIFTNANSISLKIPLISPLVTASPSPSTSPYVAPASSPTTIIKYSSPSPSTSVSASPSPSVSSSPTYSPTYSPTTTVSPSPSTSVSASPSPSVSSSPTYSPTTTASPSPSPTSQISKTSFIASVIKSITTLFGF